MKKEYFKPELKITFALSDILTSSTENVLKPLSFGFDENSEL